MASAIKAKSFFLLFAASLIFAVGCETTQSVIDIRQHPTEDVTIIHTVQQGGTSSGHRFWHCVREGDELVCDLVCGEDISCPSRPGLIRAHRSAAAQLGGTAVAASPTDAPADVQEEEDDQEWSTQRRRRQHEEEEEADEEEAQEEEDREWPTQRRRAPQPDEQGEDEEDAQ